MRISWKSMANIGKYKEGFIHHVAGFVWKVCRVYRYGISPKLQSRLETVLISHQFWSKPWNNIKDMDQPSVVNFDDSNKHVILSDAPSKCSIFIFKARFLNSAINTGKMRQARLPLASWKGPTKNAVPRRSFGEHKYLAAFNLSSVHNPQYMGEYYPRTDHHPPEFLNTAHFFTGGKYGWQKSQEHFRHASHLPTAEVALAPPPCMAG